MIEELKKVLLNDLLEQLHNYEEIQEKINKIEEKYNNIKEPEYFDSFEPYHPSAKHGTLFKVFRSGKYKEELRQFQIQKDEYDRLRRKYEEQQDYYDMEKPKLKKEIEELKKQIDEEQLIQIKERIEAIKKAKNLKELGFNFHDLVRIFKDHNIPLVLTEKDHLIQNESEFDKKSDLVLVHKTAYAPSGDEIKSRTSAKTPHTTTIDTGKTTIDVEFLVKRDTIHFAVNGEVTDHIEFSTFAGRKYAIIIPFEEVNNIVSFTPNDSYSNGNVDITKGIILCPEEEIEKLQEQNPNTTIIGYKGEKVDGYANILISLLGYKQEDMNAHSWRNTEDINKLCKYEGTHFSLPPWNSHSGTYFSEKENVDTSISFFVSLAKKLKEEDIPFDVEHLADMISGIDHSLGWQLQLQPGMFDFEKKANFPYNTLKEGETYQRMLEDLKDYDIEVPWYLEKIQEPLKNGYIDEVYTYPKDEELIEYLNKCQNKIKPWMLPICAIAYSVFRDIQKKKEKNITIN